MIGFLALLALLPARSSPLDLEVAGLPNGTAFVPAEKLRALADPERHRVPLSVLWSDLGPPSAADCLIATCSDGYVSVFPLGFIRTYRPFLVAPSDPKGDFDIDVPRNLGPGVPPFLDLEHKEPWGVVRLEFARLRDRFAWAYAGPRSGLGESGRAGRTIWINSCASCHTGPEGAFGGTKSGKPFAFLAAIARSEPALFARYVRDPKSVAPSAKMEPHPHYTDAQLAALTAFVSAGVP